MKIICFSCRKIEGMNALQFYKIYYLIQFKYSSQGYFFKTFGINFFITFRIRRRPENIQSQEAFLKMNRNI